MKKLLASVVALAAMAISANAADATVKLTDVHLCCAACVTGVNKAVEATKVTAVSDRTAKTVTLTGADTASLQKAADALIAAGYFGKSGDDKVKLVANTGAKDKKVTTAKVSGVHLCCNNCVTAVNNLVKTVAGATGNDAKKDATSFNVTGDFNQKDLSEALLKAGLSGKIE